MFYSASPPVFETADFAIISPYYFINAVAEKGWVKVD
jgi:hypothetical protein